MSLANAKSECRMDLLPETMIVGWMAWAALIESHDGAIARLGTTWNGGMDGAPVGPAWDHLEAWQ